MATETDYQHAAEERGLSEGLLDELRRTRGLSLEGLREIPDRALRRAVRRLDYPDLARAREAFRLRQARNDAGRGAARGARGGAARARQHARPARRAARSWRACRPAATSRRRPWCPAAPASAAARGRGARSAPGTSAAARARSSSTRRPRAACGRAASAAGSGRPTTAAQSWEPVDDFMANLAVSCMVHGPDRPEDHLRGHRRGLLQPRRPARRRHLPHRRRRCTGSRSPSTTGANFQHVNRLAISTNGQVMLAATAVGIFRSTDPARLVWTRTLPDAIADVEFHPTDNSLAIAGGLRNGQAYSLGRRRPDLEAGDARAAVVGPGRAHLRREGPDARLRVDRHGVRRDLALDQRRQELLAADQPGRRPARPVPRRPGLVRQRHLGRRPDEREPRDRRRHRPLAQHRRRQHARTTSAPGGTRGPPTPTTTASSPTRASTARPTGRVFFGNDGGIYKADQRPHAGQRPAATAREGLDRAGQHLRRDPVLRRRRPQRAPG